MLFLPGIVKVIGKLLVRKIRHICTKSDFHLNSLQEIERKKIRGKERHRKKRKGEMSDY